MLRKIVDVVLVRIGVAKNVAFGDRFHVGPRSRLWAPRSLTIGNDVYVGKNVTIEVDGSIGDGVLIANNVGIVGRTDHDSNDVGTSVRRSRWVGDFPDELSATTTIGADVWIGFGAVVLSGVSIGDSAIIAAGSVVVSNVEANSVMAGNPAKHVKSRFGDRALLEHWRGLQAKGVRLSQAPQ